MSIIPKLTSCFSPQPPGRYTALAKKDEDFGVQQANDWVTAHPIEYIQKEIRYSNFKKINNYANEAMKSLEKVPLTPTTLEILKPHFVEMAKKSNNLQQALIKRLFAFHAEKSLRISLIDALSSTFETS